MSDPRAARDISMPSQATPQAYIPSGAVILAFPARGWQQEEGLHFTFQDRVDLASWDRTRRSGRLLIEHGQRNAGPDRAAFALIYLRDDPWSRWGLTRSHRGVLTWCCRTGQDVNCTPTMAAALAMLRLE